MQFQTCPNGQSNNHRTLLVITTNNTCITTNNTINCWCEQKAYEDHMFNIHKLFVSESSYKAGNVCGLLNENLGGIFKRLSIKFKS